MATISELTPISKPALPLYAFLARDFMKEKTLREMAMATEPWQEEQAIPSMEHHYSTILYEWQQLRCTSALWGGGNAGHDGDTEASLVARAPLFLEKASLKCHEKNLYDAIKCSLGFPENWPWLFL